MSGSAAAPAATTSSESASRAPVVNDAHLVGRLAAVPVERELPSGDVLVTFRLVVPRPPERRLADVSRRAVTVDTVDCVAFGSRERKRLLKQEPDTVLEVWGALRRRFYRGPAGLGSRYEVAASRLAVVPTPPGG